ncbi:hypothetical protein PPM_p0289 (plasmid) [Paenibacillus polymyxa M1]|uniref:hypothetical protein n=1 Tax=Paenibacillus polymyxa TaxID=1406 RepID=UPI00021BBAAB|nr:hypothetical protein [Paenibacillus polymyxa]CCC86439.1 hypothetical protein PPM_p0289 [Paenibacillus polymyxa M1]
MKKGKIMLSLLSACVISSMFAAVMNAEDNSTISANDSLESHMVYTTVPDSAELERQEQYKLETPKAWVEDLEGNTKEVPYIVPNSEISTQSWSDSNFTYVFNRFVMNNYKKDPKRFFIDKVTVENRSSGVLPLKYIQQNSVVSTWGATANLQVDAELKVKFFASLKASVGGSYSYQKTTSSSTTIEAGPKNIPAGYKASYTKYRAGGYGAGQAVWKMYVKNTGVSAGEYKTGESAWAPSDNETTIEYAESRL